MTDWTEPAYCLTCDEPESMCQCPGGPRWVYRDDYGPVTPEMIAALLKSNPRA